MARKGLLLLFGRAGKGENSKLSEVIRWCVPPYSGYTSCQAALRARPQYCGCYVTRVRGPGLGICAVTISEQWGYTKKRR